jgi:hypothetical protein
MPDHLSQLWRNNSVRIERGWAYNPFAPNLANFTLLSVICQFAIGSCLLRQTRLGLSVRYRALLLRS